MKIRSAYVLLAAASLLACLAAPLLYFFGILKKQDFQTVFMVASAGWFIFAVLLNRSRTKAA